METSAQSICHDRRGPCAYQCLTSISYTENLPRPHAGQTRLTVTSLHAKRSAIQTVLMNLAGFLQTLKTTAEQWTDAERLHAILTRAFAKFMFPTAGPPALLAAETVPT